MDKETRKELEKELKRAQKMLQKAKSKIHRDYWLCIIKKIRKLLE